MYLKPSLVLSFILGGGFVKLLRPAIFHQIVKDEYSSKGREESARPDAKNESDAAAPLQLSNPDYSYLWNGEEIFRKAAQSMPIVTDKVASHTYQIMYGQFLLP